ncbi:HPr family phosphocarrier protein [Stutzerimonas nitrititolerans]|uniref:HPr family phosphocarrier protein n=1 Tax=Stutzerimonas nitrititolerans TaxID=2482751 RepID=UPI000718708D|nr:HPr family phosphocarrier protein [Stutzerimonas nitrititolerans]KRW60256.1 phosphocarrier protein HPr [Pseudomonas sp. TTU2014-066ASC]MBA1186942.1 HPr family phosphocarrier protein [Stutzerimonas stutzeri]OCX23031.1 phosphocarrier protein HPr [Stutzerimonas xanthomarina]NNT94219.1 HPr family phosphocarrier protein [Stutzerimonas nitrititolerans]SUD83444.1 PTS system phosphocarrier protein HPr [Stutzerimonas stutzeri]
MPACDITIINKLGLHARAAAKFVGTASRFPCDIRVGRCPNTLVDGKNIMAVMMLAASQGTPLHLRTEGEQEEHALEALKALIEDYFEEGE